MPRDTSAESLNYMFGATRVRFVFFHTIADDMLPEPENAIAPLRSRSVKD